MRLRVYLRVAASCVAVLLTTLVPTVQPASAGPVAGHAQQLAEIPGVAVLGGTTDAASNLYLLTIDSQSFQPDKVVFGVYEVSQGGTVTKLRDLETSMLSLPAPIGVWNGYLYLSGFDFPIGPVMKPSYVVWALDLASPSSAMQPYLGPTSSGMPAVKADVDPGYRVDPLTGTVYAMPRRKSGSRALVSVAATSSPSVPGAITDLGDVTPRELTGVVGGRLYAQVNDRAKQVSRLEFKDPAGSSFSDLGLRVPFDANTASPRMALASCNASGDCLYSSYRPRSATRPRRTEVVWYHVGQRTTVLTGSRMELLSSAVAPGSDGQLYAIRAARLDFTVAGLVVTGSSRVYAVS